MLWQYHQLLRSANAQLNLTRIHNFENMVLKHYVDSLLVLNYVELPSPLIDMGSGPGLPGIPLKIGAGRRDDPGGATRSSGGVLREVCDKLGLKKTEVYAHKLGSDYPNPVAGVISRAVGSIPETLDRVAACLSPGGRMIFMKGPECGDEVVEAEASHADLFRLSADHSYVIPGTPHRRRLLVYERLDGEAPSDQGLRRAREAEPAMAFSGSIRESLERHQPQVSALARSIERSRHRVARKSALAGSRVLTEVLGGIPNTS